MEEKGSVRKEEGGGRNEELDPQQVLEDEMKVPRGEEGIQRGK